MKTCRVLTGCDGVTQVKRIVMLAGLLVGCLAIFVQAETLQVVGTEYPPFTYTNPEDGKPAGFSFDLLRAMFAELKIDATFTLYPWKRAETMLAEEPNTLAFLARTEPRETLYHWVGPVYPRALYLYRLTSRPEVALNTIDDVKPYKVGVVRGFASITEVTKAGVPESNLEEVADDALNIKKLFEHHVDLIPNNDLVLASRLRQEEHSFSEVEKAFVITPEGASYFYFGLSKATDAQLVQKLQQAFDQLKQDGGYERILHQYLQ